MNIIKIGKEYVNLDNIVTINIGDRDAYVRTQGDIFRISIPSSYEECELKELLEKMSKKTVDNWE